MCELTNNMWWTELCKPGSLLSEMLTVCVDSMKHFMPLVVTPSFNIQFITFCIMYTLPSLPPPPETPTTNPIAFTYQHRTNETVTMPCVVCFKAECVLCRKAFRKLTSVVSSCSSTPT